MNLLNLDELSSPKKTVTIFGKSYEIAEQSLGTLLKILAENKKNKNKKFSEEQVAEQIITQASHLLPECPVEQLKKLNMRQLNALIEFARMSDEDIEETVENSEVESEENSGK